MVNDVKEAQQKYDLPAGACNEIVLKDSIIAIGNEDHKVKTIVSEYICEMVVKFENGTNKTVLTFQNSVSKISFWILLSQQRPHHKKCRPV